MKKITIEKEEKLIKELTPEEAVEAIAYWFKNKYDKCNTRERIHIMSNIAIQWLYDYCQKEKKE